MSTMTRGVSACILGLGAIGLPGDAHAACAVTPAGALPLQVICDPGAGETVGITPENGVFVRSGSVSSFTQGNNAAYFEMSGGTLDALNQGGSFNVFQISGGQITGAVVGTAFGRQSGGTIDSISLASFASGYHLTAGRIDRFLLSRAGDDFLLLAGGAIGFDPAGGSAGAGNSIVTGAGHDKIILDGTQIEGDVVLFNPSSPAAESDFLELRSGTILGQALLGDGSDLVVVRQSFTSDFATGVVGGIDAGDGVSSPDGWIDVLLLDGWSGDLTGASILNFETIVVAGGTVGFTDASIAVASADGTGVFVNAGGALDLGAGFTLNGNLSLGGTPVTNFAAANYGFADAATNTNAFYTIDAALYDRTGPAAITLGGITGGQLLAGGVGEYRITGDVRNGGTIDLRGASATSLLRIDGSYAGGGRLILDAVFGGDGSAADRLVIAGDTTGATLVQVVNAGGAGAQTVEGIRLVEVGGVSGGSFDLLGDYLMDGRQYLVVGEYAYGLYQGGVSTPSDGHWYLRSSWMLQPAVAVVEGYAATLLQTLAPRGLPSLRQRHGARIGAGGDGASGKTGGAGSWLAVEANYTRLGGEHSSTGAESDTDLYKVQAGIDGVLYASAGDRLTGSLWLQYSDATSDLVSATGGGSISVESLGVGAALTWSGDDGFYIDAQGLVTWSSGDLTSSVLGDLAAENSGTGFAVSLEGGRSFALGGSLSLTPQAQITYARVSFDDFTQTAGAAQVALAEGESLSARIGLSLDHQASWLAADGTRSQSSIYGIVNAYAELLDGTSVHVGASTFGGVDQGWWGELGIGFERRWSDGRVAFFGEASAAASLEQASDSYALRASGGLRLSW